MAVIINKTDGIVLTTIDDGDVDVDTTNIALIGRLYRNYGELVNENFVKLLENFASSNAPTQPMVGQLWYNSSTGIMNVYRSSGFTGLANLSTSAAQPNLAKQGDLWFDTVDEQLKLYTGSGWIVISPQYKASQTKTGVFAETIRDVLNTNHVCLVHYQQNSVTAIHCRDTDWVPQSAISGFTTIKPGFNLANVNSQLFQGNSFNALNLGNVAADKFVRNDQNEVIDGSLTLATTGLKIGEFEEFNLYLDGADGVLAKTDGRITFAIADSPILRISELGQTLVTSGTVQEPSISFMEDTNTGMYRDDENVIGLAIAGQKIVEISDGGIYVYGNIQADNYTGTLNAGEILAANVTISNTLRSNGTTIIGNSSTDLLTVNADTVNIPNNLEFTGGEVTFSDIVTFGSSITVPDLSQLDIDADVYITGNNEITGALIVNAGINVGGILIGDTGGRLRLNSSVATGYANLGDFSMGSTNGIRSYNSPKMWIAFGWSSPNLLFYDSFNIDAITRTSTNNYAITTEYPISSGAMAVVGTNGIQLAIAPSIGATSFTITTTSESSRMAFVVLSQ
jgi:hypothetical protein